MCGIFAAIRTQGVFDPDQTNFFRELTDRVKHRGPDAGKHLTFATSSEEQGFNIFFGHRRLAIIDLSDSGTQPMSFDGIHIVFNGEIFNYIELRRELQKKGVQFHTETDTEVIIRVYQHHGADGFHLFNGMWAFVLFDSQKQEVIASRDRFSIKPLYYVKHQSDIYFASEIKQLLPLLEHKKVNQSAFARFINQALIDDQTDTFFEHVRKVAPRTNYHIDLKSGKQRHESYWDFERKQTLYSHDLVSQFRELFFDSVRIRLRSDVKTGALLSGGLDSSAITVVAQEMLSDRFSSYSVVSDHKKYSEAGFINLLVKEKGIENYQLSLELEKMLGMLDKVIEYQDEPFAGMSMVAQYQIFQKIKQETDVTVVLSGQGGDEILMGYLKFYFFYLQKLRRDGAYLQMLKELFASLIHRTMLWQFDFAHAKRYLPGKAGAAKTYQLYTYSPESTWMANDIRERQIADIERFSVPALAHYEDRNSMAWSIESRLPFMDHRLVNFMLNVAESEKIRNGWSKYLLRKSMHELPDAIRWRRDKKGFTLPEEVWTRTTLRGEIMSAFKQSQLDALGLIDAQKLMEAYQAYLTGKPSMHYSEILRIFIAEKWAKQHFA